MTLDELIEHPEKAAALAPDARQRILLRVTALLAALAAIPAEAAAPVGTDGDRVVGITEAAQVLGMTEDSLYRKWRTLGVGYRDVDRRVKFSLAALHKYIARRAGKPS